MSNDEPVRRHDLGFPMRDRWRFRETLALTELHQPAESGATRLEGEFPNFEPGDRVCIGSDDPETGVVADTGSIILTEPLEHDHPAGSPVARSDVDIIERVRDLAADPQPDTPVVLPDDAGADGGDGAIVLLSAAAGLVVLAAGAALFLRSRRNRTTT